MIAEEQPNSFYTTEGTSIYLTRSLSELRRTSFRTPRMLVKGGLRDIKLIPDPEPGKFIDLDKDWKRLNRFVRLTWGPNNTSVYVVDYHQFALFGWCEAFLEGRVQTGVSLSHWDAHLDATMCRLDLMSQETFRQKGWSLVEIVKYVRRLNCWDFIDPAVKLGLVNKIYCIGPGPTKSLVYFPVQPDRRCAIYQTGRDYYERHNLGKNSNKIADVDFDYFLRVENSIEEELCLDTIREDISTAGVATLATSPGFIKPERAIGLIKKLLI